MNKTFTSLLWVLVLALFSGCTSGWSSAGNLSSNRATHAATLLPNGKVLITAGRTEFNAVATAELYDPTAEVYEPATNTWTTVGSMKLAGTSNPTHYKLAELYTP